jgi:hypothetical protein
MRITIVVVVSRMLIVLAMGAIDAGTLKISSSLWRKHHGRGYVPPRKEMTSMMKKWNLATIMIIITLKNMKM